MVSLWLGWHSTAQSAKANSIGKFQLLEWRIVQQLHRITTRPSNFAFSNQNRNPCGSSCLFQSLGTLGTAMQLVRSKCCLGHTCFLNGNFGASGDCGDLLVQTRHPPNGKIWDPERSRPHLEVSCPRSRRELVRTLVSVLSSALSYAHSLGCPSYIPWFPITVYISTPFLFFELILK